MFELLTFFKNKSNYFTLETSSGIKTFIYKDISTSEELLFFRISSRESAIQYKNLWVFTITHNSMYMGLGTTYFEPESFLEEYKDNNLFNISMNTSTNDFKELFSCTDFERFIEIAKNLQKGFKNS